VCVCVCVCGCGCVCVCVCMKSSYSIPPHLFKTCIDVLLCSGVVGSGWEELYLGRPAASSSEGLVLSEGLVVLKRASTAVMMSPWRREETLCFYSFNNYLQVFFQLVSRRDLLGSDVTFWVHT